MRKGVYVLLVGVCLFAAGFSAAQIVRQLSEYWEGERAYAQLTQEVVQTQPAPAPTPLPEEPEPSGPEEPLWPEVDFSALLSLAPDVVAWLYGPGTGVNYPVVQGEDNDFYLDHLYDGTVNSAGSLFLDVQAGSLENSRRWVIYGHYMRNGTMFADLLNYKEQSYYDEHPVFLLVTPEARYRVELFSGYVAGVDADAWRLEFTGEEDFSAWLAGCKAASAFQSDVEPWPDDQIITFSTCSYEFSNARFVLHGVLQKVEGT